MAVFVAPPIRPPVRRPLRVFAFDPMRKGPHNVVTIEVEEEPVGPGPSGGRVRVVDYDATTGAHYAPVGLDDPAVLMQGGLEPSEDDPRFHQQKVYAVTLKVLENFDRRVTVGWVRLEPSGRPRPIQTRPAKNESCAARGARRQDQVVP